jgi:Mg2+/citrate symporter
MLVTLGFLTIVVLLAAILSQKMTPLTALVARAQSECWLVLLPWPPA